MNANAPTLPVAPPAAYAAKKFRSMSAFTPEGAEYVEQFLRAGPL